MRLVFRRWMVVAQPAYDGQQANDAAKAWNRTWLHEGLNRFLSKDAAEAFADEEQRMWSPYLFFEVVDRRKFNEGWM